MHISVEKGIELTHGYLEDWNLKDSVEKTQYSQASEISTIVVVGQLSLPAFHRVSVWC